MPIFGRFTQRAQQTLTLSQRIAADLQQPYVGTEHFLLALLKMGIHAIRRFFRSFTVDLFRLHLIVASPDPYDTAVRYGSICSAVEALPELCGARIRVLRRDIEIGSDFLAEKPTFTGEIDITLQLFRLVHMAVAFAAEFIVWKIKNRRSSAHEHRKEG